MSENKNPAFPVPKINSGAGFTKREYAAILLRVPDSGSDWLDEMIVRAHKIGKPPQLIATDISNTGALN